MLRFHVPAEKKLVHEMTIPIRWGDMDAMGHVNNTVYFRYFETSRLEWLGSIGAPAAPDGTGPVIVNAFCNFLRQLTYPGTLRVCHYVAHVGRTSFDTYFTLERIDEPGLVSAEGGARVVWLDARRSQSVPLPDWVRAHLV